MRVSRQNFSNQNSPHLAHILSLESNYERGPVVRRKFCMQKQSPAHTPAWQFFLQRRKVRVLNSMQTTVMYCRLDRTLNADFPPPKKNCMQKLSPAHTPGSSFFPAAESSRSKFDANHSTNTSGLFRSLPVKRQKMDEGGCFFPLTSFRPALHSETFKTLLPQRSAFQTGRAWPGNYATFPGTLGTRKNGHGIEKVGYRPRHLSDSGT